MVEDAPASADPQSDSDEGLSSSAGPETALTAGESPVALTPELQQATAFAVQFAHDYLNYDQERPEVRERELRAYLAPGLDPQLGWNGQGTQLAVLTVPISAVGGAGSATVIVAAQVTGADAPRWVHLSVPVLQDDRGRWAVSAQPAYVPRPGAGNPDIEAPGVDQALSIELTPAMEQFFTAYASEVEVAIAGVTSPESSIRGLAAQVTFSGIDAVRIEAGDPASRQGTVSVTWVDPVTDGSIAQTYDLRLIASDGSWLIEGIDAG
jgi:hypothetical protein